MIKAGNNQSGSKSIHNTSVQGFINRYNKSLSGMISLNCIIVKIEKLLSKTLYSSIVEKKITWQSEKGNS